jgi:tetratricopeptide (TPR) repeat protein
MAQKKPRLGIPSQLAARVLFLADRTCCVCRQFGKPVQIHHIDDNPSHNTQMNLAVLCFDCHRETQIRGGFDRKLDAEQVILYRNDWQNAVARQRATADLSDNSSADNETDSLERITSVVEIYRDNKEFSLVAITYHTIGNTDLRDKYIELAILEDPTDFNICFLRGLQEKPELIPEDVIEREIGRYTRNQDWSQRARLYYSLGRYQEAVADYIKSINKSLSKGRIFSAAYYLKEIVKNNLVQELFIEALGAATDEGNLWWQVRALQELEWYDGLKELLLQNEERIEQSNDPGLIELLTKAKGDHKRALEVHKEIARETHSTGGGEVRTPIGRSR